MRPVNTVNDGPGSIPPSARLVLDVLEDGRSRTFKEVAQQADIAPRTIRFAIGRLKKHGLIVEKFNFRDARQVLYQIRDVSAPIDEAAVYP
ncbi:MAG: winged helix-turn-helix transcriptional regulator [Methanomicrobiales archaeon]|nr:winged helix-turn-helix transcriptional regulator [Methanomicrobiales archaeon]